MNHSARIITLLTSVLCLAGHLCGALYAQTAVPATAPTTITPSQLPSANPAIPHNRPDVQWDGHLLRVTASGESLAAVFGEIAADAGIRMSGTPPNDRVYGTYGPAPLVDVLSDLVDGLPVNMLFVDRAGSMPARLTFTARIGGASAAGSSQSLAQQQPAGISEQPSTSQQSPSIPVNSSTVAPNPGIGNGTGDQPGSQPTGGTTNAESPNGVRTPQEIFEQLQRLRATSNTPR